MDLVNFSPFILSYLTIPDFELWGVSLQELTYLMPFTISQTCDCLMANLVLLNLTLSLTVHFRAVHGNTAIHMRITHVPCFSSILPPPCSCIMLLISIMLVLDDISRSDTNMYIQYDSICIKAKESTGIPSLILLEFHPSKQTRSNSSLSLVVHAV